MARWSIDVWPLKCQLRTHLESENTAMTAGHSVEQMASLKFLSRSMYFRKSSKRQALRVITMFFSGFIVVVEECT